MKRDQIARGDFPDSEDGYDRESVDAHLAAVAAWTAALEAQISALEVERDALRGKLAENGERVAAAPAAASPPPAETAPAEPVDPDEGPHQPAGSEPDPEPEAGEDEVSARLVATRLSLEGKERDEIVSRLSDEYELEDPEALVEDVLTRLA